jgi:hypothetical protein
VWKTAAAPPSFTTQLDCDLRRPLTPVFWLSVKLASDHASGRKPESQFFASGTFQFGLVTF